MFLQHKNTWDILYKDEWLILFMYIIAVYSLIVHDNQYVCWWLILNIERTQYTLKHCGLNGYGSNNNSVQQCGEILIGVHR
jgi:hypothetical protein